VHSIMKFAVQVTVHCDFKSYHSILYDLQRNYDNIAITVYYIQIITARDNEIILVHKDVLMLRSPVFKALFDRLHYLRLFHIIHELPSMHGHVTWYNTYYVIRHLPSIHTFLYHVSFLLYCSTVGRHPSTDYKYDFDSVSGIFSCLRRATSKMLAPSGVVMMRMSSSFSGHNLIVVSCTLSSRIFV